MLERKMRKLTVLTLIILASACKPTDKTWEAWVCDEGRAFYTQNSDGNAKALIYDELISNINILKTQGGQLWQFISPDIAGHQGNIKFQGDSARIWDINTGTNKIEWSFDCKRSKKVIL
ncbi:hypothetical protein [Citrobacter freundii]|uniref:hypothetical protein n=1 Tax=Citrobacter freundii TaxID=546 RepID=UPI001BCA9544|nr:hypothetical protein [Citrobacter freundii]